MRVFGRIILFLGLACSTTHQIAHAEAPVTAAELVQKNPLPSRASITGKITAIDSDGLPVANKLNTYVILDGALACYVKLPIVKIENLRGANAPDRNYVYSFDPNGFILSPSAGKVEILRAPQVGSGIARATTSKTLQSQFVNSYSRGMQVVVSGDLSKAPNGKVILRGELRGLGSHPPALRP